MFLRNCWYVAARDSELDDRRLVARRILGEPMLFFRTADGTIAAFQDRCPHRLAPLSAGRRIGDRIRCGYHGIEFAADGRCVHIPGQDTVPASAGVRTFPALLRHGCAWVWPGDPTKADPALIPDVPWPRLAGWATAEGYTHVAADYRLLTDNLLDLSHETYLHDATIGNQAEQTIADYPVTVGERPGQVIEARRVMAGIDAPPFFAMILGTDGRIDRWQAAIWAPPCVNLTDTKAAPAGATDAQPYVGRVLHLLTPETAASTHYFWSLSRNYRTSDDELTELLRGSLRQTFDEDKYMLELQQREVAATGLAIPGLAVKLDVAAVRARRILDGLIRRERDGAAPAIGPAVLVD